MAKLAPIVSLADLAHRARTDNAYAVLTIAAARNLGYMGENLVGPAHRHLEREALETDEDGVVAEINFCR